MGAYAPNFKEWGVDIKQLKSLSLEDIFKFILDITSEATGYPVEIINIEQNLEQDLGIDSIMKVAILDKLSEKYPFINQMSFEDMVAIKTLRQAGEYIKDLIDKL